MQTTSRHRLRLTPRPPLGWNSFDCYGCSANQRVVAANIQAFAERLKPAGYEYVVIDNGWFGEYVIQPGEEFTRERHASDVRVDAFGRLLPSHVSFPGGLAPLIDQAHKLGVKFGVHLMRGIPRKAVALNLPIEGTSVRAAEVADTNDTCPWCAYMYGVNMDRPGAQAYYDSVVGLLASWGVDFIKVDDIIHKPQEIEAVVTAIDRCGRDMVLSLSPGEAVNLDYLPAYRRANMIRITGDVWDRRRDIDRVFERWEKIQDAPLDGLWPDLDMIPFGSLMVWNPPGPGREDCRQLVGHGVARTDQFTQAQRRTFITQRALAASPLFMGGELTLSGDDVLALITDPRMLACNQNGVVGRLALRRDPIDVWRTAHRDRPGAGWLGIFNRGEAPWSGTIGLDEIGLSPATGALESVWNNARMQRDGGRLAVQLNADDVLFVRF